VIGAVLVVIAMVVVLPVLIFLAGAGWSALLGTSLAVNSEEPAPAGDS